MRVWLYYHNDSWAMIGEEERYIETRVKGKDVRRNKESMILRIIIASLREKAIIVI